MNLLLYTERYQRADIFVLTSTGPYSHEQQWTITHNYEQWRWKLRIGNPHSTPCPTLEATFGVTRLVDKTWVVPSSLGNVLVSVVRPVIWCQESWDNVIMSQAHGGRQVMGMKGMWDSSECPKKRFSFEIIRGGSKESEVLKFMVCRGDELGRGSFMYVSKWTVLFYGWNLFVGRIAGRTTWIPLAWRLYKDHRCQGILKKRGGGIEVPPKLRGGIQDTNILILDKPSTPSKVRTDLISLSTFRRLSTWKHQEAKAKW